MSLLRGLCILLLALAWAPAQAAKIPPIAAAADLKFALEEIALSFRHETGHQLKLSFGSSGNFTHQIEQGAPFELFLSADENFVFRLADKGLTRDRGTLYGIGRLVLFAPHHSQLTVDSELRGLKAALEAGRIRRFAIANPDHAPYGRAARAALEYAGLWSLLQPRLVLGENASQATQFAASGSSQGGIVPLSLSKAEAVARLGSFALIPAEWHSAEPLRQRMVLLKSGGDTACAFYAYLQQPAAREIFLRYGFLLPDEAAQR
ncbi:MAG: molybdate ABC transporter substrate-binding protein [Desulfuromonadales bacterium]|nr:molybdate ABC transporter substrate-binding protein [Desulfuromonadales bacterium]